MKHVCTKHCSDNGKEVQKGGGGEVTVSFALWVMPLSPIIGNHVDLGIRTESLSKVILRVISCQKFH